MENDTELQLQWAQKKTGQAERLLEDQLQVGPVSPHTNTALKNSSCARALTSDLLAALLQLWPVAR